MPLLLLLLFWLRFPVSMTLIAASILTLCILASERAPGHKPVRQKVERHRHYER
jgi:hypothetical protein